MFGAAFPRTSLLTWQGHPYSSGGGLCVAHARALSCLYQLMHCRVAHSSVAHAALTASIRVALTYLLLCQHADSLDALADSGGAVLPDSPPWRNTGTLATPRSALARANTLPLERSSIAKEFRAGSCIFS